MSRCPSCFKPFTRDYTNGFDALSWDACNDPAQMRAVLNLLMVPVSVRKLRLGACWICRTEFDWCRNPRFLEAITVAEAFADDEASQRDRQEAYDWLLKTAVRIDRSANWREAGLWSLAPENPGPRGLNLHKVMLPADWFREAFGNPFDEVTFDPEWRTSSAVGLARVMIERRQFDLFPYLADALQDAGCDDSRVRAHCESNRPHGRGCWLLDAILGKS